jgi:hypothetical protein
MGGEELGLSLEDGKEIVREIQSRMIAVQVEMFEAASSLCIHCGRRKDIKDRRPRQFRSVFGVVRVCCRRFVFCTCRGGKARNEWPLRHFSRSSTTPELRYLFAKFGGAVPYRRAAKLLTELLALPNGSVSHTTIRRHTLLVAKRFDQRAVEPSEYDWPQCQRELVMPAHRVTVAIDGTYIRAGLDSWNRQLHVVAGRVDRHGKLGSHFAWIATESVALCHMKAVLEDHGCHSNSMVAVLADGADGLGGIVQRATPQAPRTILDWFHVVHAASSHRTDGPLDDRAISWRGGALSGMVPSLPGDPADHVRPSGLRYLPPTSFDVLTRGHPSQGTRCGAVGCSCALGGLPQRRIRPSIR